MTILIFTGCENKTEKNKEEEVSVVTEAEEKEDFTEVNEVVKEYVKNAYEALEDNCKFTDTLEINNIICSWWHDTSGKFKSMDISIDYSSDDGEGVTRKTFYLGSASPELTGVVDIDSEVATMALKMSQKCLTEDYKDYFPDGTQEILGTDYVCIKNSNGALWYYYKLNDDSLSYCIK